MQHISLYPPYRSRQKDLFPKRIETAPKHLDMEIRSLLQTDILTWSHKDPILIYVVKFLEAADDFEDHEIHSVLIASEYSLCFNCYSHGPYV